MKATRGLSQDEFFAEAEGDAYYKRNREAMAMKGAATDPPIRLVKEYGIEPRNVLELGCANGWRLSLMRRLFDCRCVGIDASREAVEGGMQDDPALELKQGMLAEVPIRDERFDLVVIYFVFHWNARSTLMRAAAEADRLLEDGGYLIVGDFLPDTPQKRPYHHAAGEPVFTYKQDYAAMFTATHLYFQVARLTLDATDAGGRLDPAVPASNRGGCTLLRKSCEGAYPVVGEGM